VVLVLGGLLALGLLVGGRAEAQERPDAGPLTVSVAHAVPEGATTEAAVRKAVEPSARRIAEQVTEQAVEPVTEPVVEPVVEKAVNPVDRAARQHATAEPSAAPAAKPSAPADVLGSAPARVSEAVVEGVGGAVDRVAGEARPLVPALPGLPPLFSVLPESGGEPAAPDAPSPSVPGAGRGAEDGRTAPCDARTDTSVEHTAGRGTGTPGSAPGAPDAGPARGSAPTQAQDRAPFDPCGDLVRTAAADAQGPRGGDPHAVPAPRGPYAALVRGAGLPATAAPIPDRSGEILAFPG
jgi:hypothetical protein